MDERISLRPVDALSVTILVDNSIDLLMTGSDSVRRASLIGDWAVREPLIAEHGYSALLTIKENGTVRNILYDAGLGKGTLLHNMAVLGLSVKDIDAVVLSHGHADHHGGLLGFAEATGKRNLPLILHPDAWRVRKLVVPGGQEADLPPPDRAKLAAADVRLVQERGPSLAIGESVLVSGQVERTTEFEKGLPIQSWRNHTGIWEPDPWTWDDQAAIVNVKGKGLVVVSGCSHAGIVNILRSARTLTGVDHVHGVMGGFHLSGGLFEPLIPPTVAAIEPLAPDVIVPGHCTGWKAIHEISRRMPQAFVPTAVGTTLRFA